MTLVEARNRLARIVALNLADGGCTDACPNAVHVHESTFRLIDGDVDALAFLLVYIDEEVMA